MSMRRYQKTQLLVTLTEELETWWDKMSAVVDMPWIGTETHELMADAALAVLFGIADAQDYLRENGQLAE